MQTFNGSSTTYKQSKINRNQVSTTDQFYPPQQQYQLYIQLMEENLWLKNQIENAKNTKYNFNNYNQTYNQDYNHNYPANYNITHQYQSKNFNTQANQLNHQANQINQVNPQYQSTLKQIGQHTELPLWSMMERNKYLQAKMQKLKHQYEKQHKSIKTIQSSSKWRNKDKCHDGTCYHNKYLQLLRVRSPFY